MDGNGYLYWWIGDACQENPQELPLGNWLVF